MTIIEPVTGDAEKPQALKRNSSALRFWHWANMIIISGSLLTVLVNSTITTRSVVVPLVKDELKQSVTDDQANGISHALGDKVWEIHTYFGYALAALFLFRIVLEFFQVTDQKLIRKIKASYIQFKTVKEQRQAAFHDFTVRAVYGGFYLLLLIMVTTGLFLAFEDLMSPFKSIRHSVRSVHGFCMYLVLAFIAAHLIGVFLAERRADSKGLISDMVNGGIED